jgi:hypothetical protein
MISLKKRKKGEITTTTLISLILLVVGFAIALFVYMQLGWSGKVNREVCHQSVILRGTAPSFGGLQGGVPLKCQTEKFCITNKLIGGKCDEFKGLDNVHKVRVSSVEDIERFIARDTIDCWKTMGEGKLALFSDWVRETWGIGEEAYPSCVICSRIAYDSALSEPGSKIHLQEINVKDYMMTHAIPNSNPPESYYSYLAGENGQIGFNQYSDNKIDSEFIVEFDFDKINSETTEVIDPKKESPPDSELAVLFMQISSPNLGDVWENNFKTLQLGALGSFVAAPTMTTKAITSVVSTKAGIVLGAAAVVFGVYQAGSVYHNQAITAGYCGDVSIGGEAREGCSVVRTTNYDANSISQYCSVIESIP